MSCGCGGCGTHVIGIPGPPGVVDPAQVNALVQQAVSGLTGIKGDKGDKGDPGEPGKDGVVEPATLPVLADPDLDTDLVVVDRTSRAEGEVKVSSWAAFKARIAAWLETVEATWSGKTLVDPEVEGSLGVDRLIGVEETDAGSGLTARTIHIEDPFRPGEDAYRFGVRSDNNALYRFSTSTLGLDIICQAPDGVSKSFTFYPTADGYFRINPPAGKVARLVAGRGDLDLRTWEAGKQVLANSVPVLTTTGIQPVANKTISASTLARSTLLDGNPIGAKVAVPASGAAVGNPGDWAANATTLFVYTGNGTAHSWGTAALTPLP